MKNNRPAYSAHRRKVEKRQGSDPLSPNTRHGETLIPVGPSDANIELPATKDTYTYEVINSDAMGGDINVSVANGNLKGMILNTTRGQLRLDPISAGTQEITFGRDMKDGSFANMISDGNDWFIWSYGIGNGFASSTVGRGGNSTGGPPNPTSTTTYAPVAIDNISISVDYPSGPAEHDFVFEGTAEPSSPTSHVTLKIYDSTSTLVETISVGANGRWTWSVNDLPNGQHEYSFQAFVNDLTINQSDFWSNTLNGGSIDFDCSQIEVEVGTTSPDFISLPTITDPSGASITPTVNATTYLSNMVEDDTFTVTFDFTYDSITYQRTVNGVVVNRVNPALPTITTVGGVGSGVAIDTTIVDIVGTALPNANVEVYIDGQSSSFASTTANGLGEWTISSHDFGFISNQRVIIRAQQQTVGGSLWSLPSNDFTVVYEQIVLDVPTVEVQGFSTNSFTNNLGSFIIQGTHTTNGEEIVLTGVTPLLTPIIVAGGSWSTTANLTNDATHNITAQATDGTNTSQQSNTFTLHVDRTPPSITTVADETLYLGSVSDTLPTATDSFNVIGNIVTVTSDTTVDNNLAEGAHIITYTATDAAGNTATSQRTITVTTEVIVPTNLVAVDNGDGTVTLTGDVVGTYANNLDVKINVIDSARLEAVYQVSSSDVSFTVTGGSFTAIMILDADTYTFEAQTINSIGEASSFDDCVASSPVTVAEPPAPVVEFYEDRLHSTTFGDYTNPTNFLDQASYYDDSTGVLTVSSYSAPEAILNVNGGTTAFATDNDPINDGDLTKKVSISMWLKTSAGFTGTRTYMQVFRVDNANTPNYPLFQIIMRNGNFVTNSPYTQGTFDLANNFTVENGFNNLTLQLLDDQWHHFMYYYDGASNGSQKIFIDGVLAASKTHNSDRGIISQYMHSGFSKFWFNKNGEDFIGGDFDSLTFYQGFEMTEEIAAWIASDLTRQRIYVEGIDVAAPTITITNDADSSDITNATVNIIEGDTFAFTVVATDDVDGNISGNVVTGGDTLDTTTAGTYNLTFNVSDAAGNPATEVTLTVEVEAYVISSEGLENRAGVTLNNASIDGDGVLVIAAASNSYASLPMTSEFKSSTNQTMSLWFKSSTTPAGGFWSRLIASHVNGSGSTNGFFLELRSSTKIYFKGATHGLLADSDPTATASSSLTDGNWHHIILSWSVVPVSSGQIRVWVDGQPITVNNQTHVGAGTDSKTTLFIGNNGFSNPMEIDAVYITEEFIDDAEALSRYNRQARVQP